MAFGRAPMTTPLQLLVTTEETSAFGAIADEIIRLRISDWRGYVTRTPQLEGLANVLRTLELSQDIRPYGDPTIRICVAD